MIKFRHLLESLFNLHLPKDELWDVAVNMKQKNRLLFNQKYYHGEQLIKKNLEQFFLILDKKYKNGARPSKSPRKRVTETHTQAMRELISEIETVESKTPEIDKFKVFKKQWA